MRSVMMFSAPSVIAPIIPVMFAVAATTKKTKSQSYRWRRLVVVRLVVV